MLQFRSTSLSINQMLPKDIKFPHLWLPTSVLSVLLYESILLYFSLSSFSLCYFRPPWISRITIAKFKRKPHFADVTKVDYVLLHFIKHKPRYVLDMWVCCKLTLTRLRIRMNGLRNLISFPYYNLIYLLFTGHPFIGTLSVAVFCSFPVTVNLIPITEVRHDLFFILIWPGLVFPIAKNWTRSQRTQASKAIPYIYK